LRALHAANRNAPVVQRLLESVQAQQRQRP